MSNPLRSCWEEIPSIRISEFPADEQQYAVFIEHQLAEVASIVRRYVFALSLFDRCQREISQANEEIVKVRGVDPTTETLFAYANAIERLRPTIENNRGWSDIAKKEAATIPFDFYKTLSGIQQNRESSAKLRALIDKKALDAVMSSFRDAFRTRDKVRHAALHPSELAQTPMKMADNAFTGKLDKYGISANISNSMISGVMAGRTVAYTIENEIVEMEFSSATLDKLMACQRQLYALFPKR